MSARISSASELGVVATVRRGVQLSPALTDGLTVTLLLALVATAGRMVVPVVIQQATDHGVLAPGGPDVGRVLAVCAVGLLVLVVTGQVSAVVNVRLYRTSERGLAQLRVRTFRHVHDLSALTQSAERRGSLVSRVTSDVDTISMFVQRGGLTLILNAAQLLLATVAMVVYDWRLALLVWLCFAPMVVLAPVAQRAISVAYAGVRVRVGAMLAAVSESVVGAETLRAFGAEARTQRRIDDAVRAHRAAAVRAQTRVSLAFSSGVVLSGVALAVVVVAGTLLGAAGQLSIGALLAFLFLVQMFTGPVQNATEMLNELQNAVAGWRRVIAVLETPADVTDPVRAAQPPPGPRPPRAARRPLRLPGRPRGAPRRRPHHPGRHTGGGRGPHRLGQDHARQAPRPADGPHGRAGAARRRGPARPAAARPARPGGAGGAGGLPLRRHPRREHRLRARPGPARRGAPRRRGARPGHAGPTPCPPASTPRSASAARRSPRGSASSSRSPAPTSPTPTSSSSTRPPPPSTRPPRPGSTAPSSGSPRAARR